MYIQICLEFRLGKDILGNFVWFIIAIGLKELKV